eukprot:1314949-Prymnesium_polylepis.1
MGAACAVLPVPSASTFPPPPSRKATRHLRRYYRQGWPGKLELSTDCASSPLGTTAPASSQQGGLFKKAVSRGVRGSEERRATSEVSPLRLQQGPRQQRGVCRA